MAKTTINGYCEIKNGEFVRFARKKEEFLGTYANTPGRIVRCKITIEYDMSDPKSSTTKAGQMSDINWCACGVQKDGYAWCTKHLINTFILGFGVGFLVCLALTALVLAQ